MSTPSDIEIDKWQQYLTASKADAAAWAKYRELNERRTVVCKEMVTFLKQYLSGECDTESLRETFDGKTRNEWVSFGFKGPAGAMFLNMLVKNIADAESLSAQLRIVLPVPADSHEGRNRLASRFLSVPGGICRTPSNGRSSTSPAGRR
jgi:hypothetical protein